MAMSIFGRSKAAARKATAEDKNKDADQVENDEEEQALDDEDQTGDDTDNTEGDGDDTTTDGDEDEKAEGEEDPAEDENTTAEKKAFRRGYKAALAAAVEVVDLCALAGKSGAAGKFLKAKQSPQQVRSALLKQTKTPVSKSVIGAHSAGAPKSGTLAAATKQHYEQKKGR